MGDGLRQGTGQRAVTPKAFRECFQVYEPAVAVELVDEIVDRGKLRHETNLPGPSDGPGSRSLEQARYCRAVANEPPIQPAVGIEEVRAFFVAELPFTTEFGIVPESIGVDESLARFIFNNRMIRPGGEIVAGPILMALADTAVYVAIFSRAGIVPMAVTNDLKITFLRPAIGRDVLARGRLLKLGRRVAYGSVDLFHPGEPDRLLAHATSSYVMPDE